MKPKLRCHVFMSPSRRKFYDKHFAPTVPKGLQVVLHKWPKKWNDVMYGTPEFNLCMQWGVRRLIKLCRTERRAFLVSDVDVRFYGEVADDLLEQLGDYWLAFQNDGPAGACKGFFMCRPGRKTAAFFQEALERMKVSGKNDQEEVNALFDTKETWQFWCLLSNRYWTHGQDDPRAWEPGQAVNPPSDILIHHANWTHGVENKLALLEAVKAAHEARQEPKAKASGPHHLIERHPLGATLAVQALIHQERARHATGHHPLPLAIVLQFWEGDKREAMELARLMADIEPAYRDDVALVLARDCHLKLDAELTDTAVYCAQKFPVRHLSAKLAKGAQYPDAANQMWYSAATQLFNSFSNGEAPHANLFFCEPDGCPMAADWIDRLKRAHAETLVTGKRVTGAKSYDSAGDKWHVNGTCVMHWSCFYDHPSFRQMRPGWGWDGVHGVALLSELGTTPVASQIIRNEYGLVGVTEAMWRHIGNTAAWLSSVKDRSHVFWSEQILVRGRN